MGPLGSHVRRFHRGKQSRKRDKIAFAYDLLGLDLHHSKIGIDLAAVVISGDLRREGAGRIVE